MIRWIQRLFAETVIVVAAGEARCIKGKFTSATLLEIGSIFDRDVSLNVEIWIGSDGRIQFSAGIPEHLRQRIRNVLIGTTS